ncbi:MAG: hypothetical protein K9K37_07055 [Desulfocapsa sp.]|nr:hypothetical protein [Desulfocapsa sp.]
MRALTRICTDQVSGNLHIALHGWFTPIAAAQLVLVMERMYQERGTIIIHTDNISTVAPKSRAALNRLLDLVNVPREDIYFFGEKGVDICCDTQRIILNKKHEPAEYTFVSDTCESTLREDSPMDDAGFLWEDRIRINRYQIT